VQLADELAACGRRVTLAAGPHTRVPRTYRGLDICWWLDAMGILARRLEEPPGPATARREPSLQLSGRPGGREVDLPALQARGVGLAGRLTGVDWPRVRLTGDLAATTGEADQRLRGLLRKIDAFAERTAIAPEAGHAEPIREAQVTAGPAELDLLHAGIGTIIWATGYQRSYLAARPRPRLPRGH
jgi:putative flavoprotein involved in K+ transport